MEVYDAIKARRSVRAFEDREIPETVLTKILEAGRLAPSANNRQPWHFIVVKDREKRVALSGGKYAHFLKETPVVVVGCGDSEASPKWHQIDVTIALENMVLTATSEGVGTCWIGSFDEESVNSALGLPPQYKVVAMLAMGYTKDKLDIGALLTRSKNRKALEDITSQDGFGRPRTK
jgi:nitroreductase